MGRGAGGRTRAEIDAAFDALGTSLDVSSDYDGVTFDLAVLKEKLEPALALLADVLLRPDFPRDEADKLKRELLAQLDELRDDDGSLVRRYFTRALYGAHPYGRTVIGTEASIEAAVARRCARLAQADARAARSLIFGIAGDVDGNDAAAAIARLFAALPAGGGGEPTSRPDVRATDGPAADARRQAGAHAVADPDGAAGAALAAIPTFWRCRWRRRRSAAPSRRA